MFSFEQTDDAQVPDKHRHDPQVQKFEEIGWLDNICFDIVSPSCHSSDKEEIKKLSDIESGNISVVDPGKEKVRAFPSASLQLLTDYGNRFKRLNGERMVVESYETESTEMIDQKLSTDAIIRLAGAKFIQSPSITGNELSELSHPFPTTFSGFSEEDNRDAELVLYLLASAEKVGEKQFDRARKLLHECDKLSSCKGSPVQRLVYYFSEALREKIDRETGKTTLNQRKMDLLDIEEEMMSPNPTILAYYKAVPFCHVIHLAGIQAVIDHVADARKIHLIDLAIRNGVQYTFLMQALATRSECPIELLKITAVGTKSKPKIEETGRRLTNFAQSLNLPFYFVVIMVEDILDLNESHFSHDSDEVFAVYSEYVLMGMIVRPDRLESLLAVIRNINPLVMIVIEVEGNLNSPVFVNRFIEALFFYGTYFDCLDECMKHDESNRMIEESFYFGKGICNVVAAEGEERTIRHVRINVWRAFFARFGMVDMELSMSSMCQAKMVLKNFSCASSCTLDMDGNCLTVGWKGTPVHSLSAWKFL